MTQEFSCELWEISENIFSTEHLRVTALHRDDQSNIFIFLSLQDLV